MRFRTVFEYVLSQNVVGSSESSSVIFCVTNISTINGAQIRTKGVQGIRFISSIDKTSADISELQVGATLKGHAVAKRGLENPSESDANKEIFQAIVNVVEQ